MITPRRMIEVVAALGALTIAAGVWLLIGLAWALVAVGVFTIAWALLIVDVPSDVVPFKRATEGK